MNSVHQNSSESTFRGIEALAVFELEDALSVLTFLGKHWLFDERDRVVVAPDLRSGDPEFKVSEGSGQLS